MTAPTLQIKRLEERVKELEAALRPFADCYQYNVTLIEDNTNGDLIMNDCKRAYELLKKRGD